MRPFGVLPKISRSLLAVPTTQTSKSAASHGKHLSLLGEGRKQKRPRGGLFQKILDPQSFVKKADFSKEIPRDSAAAAGLTEGPPRLAGR